MKNILSKANDLLERFFPFIFLIIAFFVYKKIEAYQAAKAEEEFNNQLMGVETKEVSDAKKTASEIQPQTTFEKFFKVPGTPTTEQQKQAVQMLNAEAIKKLAAKDAQALNAALNPSGSSWLRGADGTDEQAIFIVFSRIRNLQKQGYTYKAVSDAYKAAYNRNLRTDLESELDASDLKKLFG